MSNNFFKITIISMLLLISLKAFDATFLDKKMFAYLELLSITFLMGYTSFFIFKFKGGMVTPVILIYFSILFSMIMAYYSWGQGFKDSLIESSEFLWWPLFFLLLRFNLSIKRIETITLAFGVIYIILYLYQYVNSGTVIFGKPISGEEFGEQRGAVRIVFPGAGIFILSIFIAITKFSNSKIILSKLIWGLFGIIGLIIPVMQVTRQFIVGVALVYFYHFFKGRSYLEKVLIFSIFVGGVFVLLNSDIPMVKGLIETQERDSKLGSKYIRVLAGKYFLTDFSPNLPSRIFGNGAPNWGISSYGKYIERLSYEKEYFLSDVGIIAVYAMFGIFAIFGFCLMWWKCWKSDIPTKYMYVKYYLFYILFTSFTWFSVYHYHYLFSTIFALYIFQSIYIQNKYFNKILSNIDINADRIESSN